MAHFNESFEPVDLLTVEDIVFLQNLADAANNDAGEVVLGPETPTGTVNGVNTTFTVNNSPKYIVIDGMIKKETLDFTLTGSGPYTIEIDPTGPPINFIWSFY